MPIITDELKLYRSKKISDTAENNGGLMGIVPVISDIKNNVFPDVSEQDRDDGIIQYRKIFHKIENSDNFILENTQIHLTELTDSDDYVVLFEGTQSDTQDEISSPDEYGIGFLNANVSAGQDEITVRIPDETLTIFRVGDTIWISDGNNEEYHNDITSVSKTGDVVTIRLSSEISTTTTETVTEEETSGMLQNSYLAENTVVASVITSETINPSYDEWTDIGNGGEYNITTYPILIDNLGTVEDVWTITFTSTSSFTVSGVNTGILETGDINTDYDPTNDDFLRRYFFINKNGWGTGWQIGDEITFETHPASIAIWRKRIVPSGSMAVSNAGYTIRFKGESS